MEYALAAIGIIALGMAFRDKIPSLPAPKVAVDAKPTVGAIDVLFHAAVTLPAADRDKALPHLDALREIFA